MTRQLFRIGVFWGILLGFAPVKSICAEQDQRLMASTASDCLVTFSEQNDWGTIVAYYFDIEGGRGKETVARRNA